MEERFLKKVYEEICKEEQIKFDAFSYDWGFRLEKDNNKRYIINTNFGLNDAAESAICTDKVMLSCILSDVGIDHIPHELYFIMDEREEKKVTNDELEEIIKKYEFPLVVKNNKGSSGKDVYKVNNKDELEEKMNLLLNKYRALAISPFLNFDREYRLIVLRGEILLIFFKERSYVTGDGSSTLLKLITEKYDKDQAKKILENLNEEILKELNNIVECDKKVLLSWKHNLCKGAMPRTDIDKDTRTILEKIVERVQKEFNFGFVSIDIADCDGVFKILEINSGVMLTNFSELHENGYNIAKEIYRKAILEMFK